MEVELKRAFQNEEIYWRMKSRMQWLREGDKNTRFFHAQTMKRRIKNAIRGLEEEDGTWFTDRHRIQDVAVQYFHNLFTTNTTTGFQEIIDCVPCRVDQLDNNSLIALMTDMEIENALHQMHPTKSPGLDGFNVGFFQFHWETVGGVVLGMVKSFFQSGRLLRELNHTNIVLIPKGDKPRKITQFRPISLCNVVYKIISKVLTNRLKKVVSKVISPNQSAFVVG